MRKVVSGKPLGQVGFAEGKQKVRLAQRWW